MTARLQGFFSRESLGLRPLTALVVLLALGLSAIVYVWTPPSADRMSVFLEEQISLYATVDSRPQRLAYTVFLALLAVGGLVAGRLQANRQGPYARAPLYVLSFGALALATHFSLSISALPPASINILLLAGFVAALSYFSRLYAVAYVGAACVVLLCLVPGFLKVPEPDPASLVGFDQHFDTVLHQGRQLAAGHRLFDDMPVYYSFLGTALMGAATFAFGPPSFAAMIAIVKVGQVLCLLGFLYVGWLRLEGDRRGFGAFMMLMAIGAATWMSTLGLANWLPNQSGLRYLMFPVAIYAAHALASQSCDRAGLIVGGVSAAAVLYNFETGVAVTCGLGGAWLMRMRGEAALGYFRSVTLGVLAFIGALGLFLIFFRLAIGYFPFPENADSAASLLLNFGSGFGGLHMPFRPLALLIVLHAGYLFVWFLQHVFGTSEKGPDAVTAAIAIMLLVWFSYYVHRPDDWNLWTAMVLYLLLLAPHLRFDRAPVLALLVGVFLVLPIAARNFPYFVLDPLAKARSTKGYGKGCSSGLKLPQAHCAHLAERARTLKDIAGQGQALWSTSLPVLTAQTTGLKSPFWTSNLFSLALTKAEYARLLASIRARSFDYILFDIPSDDIIKPRQQEVAFHQRLMADLKGEFCPAERIGPWMVARRQGKC